MRKEIREFLQAARVKEGILFGTASGVKKIRFHDLRHTCATLLLARGMHPKIVQERLGHSNISMTPNRYSHVTPTM